jgi:hypothetical protein
MPTVCHERRTAYLVPNAWRVQKAKEAGAKAAEARRAEEARVAAAAESADARRRQAGHDDAQLAFRTLLAEAVKDPTKTWADVKVRHRTACVDSEPRLVQGASGCSPRLLLLRGAMPGG